MYTDRAGILSLLKYSGFSHRYIFLGYSQDAFFFIFLFSVLRCLPFFRILLFSEYFAFMRCFRPCFVFEMLAFTRSDRDLDPGRQSLLEHVQGKQPAIFKIEQEAGGGTFCLKEICSSASINNRIYSGPVYVRCVSMHTADTL